MQKFLKFLSISAILLLSTGYSNTGFCIYLVGLSGAGKTTIAEALKQEIEKKDPLQREALILDGDVIRAHLSQELGFSRKDRSINVRRIGYVASLFVQSGGICICSNIAPYEEDRAINRSLISSVGHYLEVFVDTPLTTCEARDPKGLYKLAREGKIQHLTGVSDPFEPPAHPDLVIDGRQSVDLSVQQILQTLGPFWQKQRR